MTQDLAARLAREGMGARRLDLAFHRVDGRVEHIRLGTARPSRDPRHLAGLFAAKLETVDPGLGVEDMILGAASPPRALPPEQTAVRAHARRLSPAAGERSSGGIAPLLDRLGARLGLDAIGRIEPRASHIPERASICVPVERSRRRHSARRSGGGARPRRAGGSGRSRQAHSLSALRAAPLRPEGGVGEQAGGSFAKPPRPVRLFASAGADRGDVGVARRSAVPLHLAAALAPRCAQADGPERIAEEWWTEDDAAGRAPAATSATITGSRTRRGGASGCSAPGLPGDPPPRWFVHGIFA